MTTHQDMLYHLGGVPVHGEMTTGNVRFVDSGKTTTGADHSYTGRTPGIPFLTLDYAIGQMAANNGDIIYVMPGHSETKSATGSFFAADTAGITIIGLGEGSDRPTFTFSHTGAAATISAANITLRNLLFVAGIDSVTAPMTISAADTKLQGIEWRDTNDIEFVRCFITTAAADRLTLEGCKHNGYTGGNASLNFCRLVGVDTAVFRDCRILGKYDTAIIEFHTTACTNIDIVDCAFLCTGTSDLSKTVLDTATSSTWQFRECFDLEAATRFSGSSSQALAGDDVGVVSTAVSTVDSKVVVVSTAVSTNSTAVSTVGVNLATVSTAVSTNSTAVSTVGVNLGTADSKIVVVSTAVSTNSTAISTVGVDLGTADSKIVVVSTAVSTNSTAISTVGVDLTTVSTAVSTNSTAVSTVGVNLGTVDSKVVVVSTAVSTNSTAVSTVGVDLATVSTAVSTNSTAVSTVGVNLGTADSKIVVVSTAVSTNSTAISTVGVDLATVSTAVSTNSTAVSTVGVNLGTADSKIVVVSTAVSTNSTAVSTVSVALSTADSKVVLWGGQHLQQDTWTDMTTLTSGTMFTWTGAIEMLYLIGTVTSNIEAAGTTVQLQANPDSLGAINLTDAVADLNNAQAGTLIDITGTINAQAVLTVGGVIGPASQVAPVMLTSRTNGVITVTYGNASSGEIRWDICWRPVSPGATVTPA